MGVHRQYLLLQSGDDVLEIFNWARTTAYLSNPDLAVDGISVCDIFGGQCDTYNWLPYDHTEGYVHYPTPAVIGNVLHVSLATFPADSSAEVRTEHVRPPLPGAGIFVGMSANPLYLRYSPTAVAVTLLDVGSTFPSAGALYTAPSMVGFPAVGQRVQWKLLWEPAVNTLSFSWRHTGPDLSDNGPVWNLAASLTTAVQMHTFGEFRLNEYGGTTQAVGDAYRWMMWLNGTLLVDANPDTDVTGDTATFVATTGQTVIVTRTGSPDVELVPPEVIVGQCGDGWVMEFDNPATDPAPWYNVNYPESADALGFFITEWTGLGEQHVSRPSTRVGGYGGGVRLGRSSADGRVMKINLNLFARTEEAMTYLFDWLGATLTGVCGGCADESLLYRRFCGSLDDPLKGLGEMRRIGVTSGLEWLADVIPRGSCQIRAASITLTAGDPCIYLADQSIEVAASNQTAVIDDCFDAATINTSRRPCRPTCIELDNDCRTIISWEANPMAAMAPVITMTNESDEPTIPFRAIVYADPLEIGVTPNPCGLGILGEIYVRPLPGWSDMVWDVAGRTVEYSDVTTGTLVDGWAYLDENDPPIPRMFNLGCGTFHLVLEPADLCGEWTGTDFEWSGMVFDDPHLPAVSVRLQERVGCGG